MRINLVIWKDKSKFEEEKGENIKKYCEHLKD